MAFDLEEQEQIAELKQFWKQYGALIVTLAVAALVAFAGMQGWRYYKHSQSEQASSLFTKFGEAVRKNDVDEIRTLGKQVIDGFRLLAHEKPVPLCAVGENAVPADGFGDGENAVGRIARRIERPDDGAHAGAYDEVRAQARLVERFEDADLGEPTRAPAAQDKGEFTVGKHVGRAGPGEEY